MTVRVLFATGHGYLPQRTGGSEISTHDLGSELLERGCRVAVLARLKTGDALAWLNRVRRKLPGGPDFPADRSMGYPVFRGWDPVSGVPEVVERFEPDLAVVQAGLPVPLAEALADRGVPTLFYLRDTQFDQMGGAIRSRPEVAFVANSRHTALRTRELVGMEVATVLPPLVRPEAYRTETTRECVVYVNPHPKKGVEIAFALAEARQDIPFLFLESWPLRRELRERYVARAGRAPNVSWSRQVADMREVYGRARLVLAPSVWEEPWGRIATEAHVSGIPVLASDRGGLPESVGPGGILVDPDAPLEAWLSALSRLWDDEDEYRRLSRKAREYADRPEIQPHHLVSRLLELAEVHIRRVRAA